MTDTTPRFALPNLISGQAQKEVTHNEALALVDGLLHPAAETMALASPPTAPAIGGLWLVAAGATGAWAGQADRLAMWTEGGWRFVAPVRGMTVWIADIGLCARYQDAGRQDAGWTVGRTPVAAVTCGGVQVVGAQQPAIAMAGGGETVDAQVRSTVDAILHALRNHGLIAT